jgi:predicted transcriptional regulator
MKKAVRDTSLKAYLEITLDGTKETQERKVLKLLQVRPSTTREVANILDKDTSSISARMNTLFKRGFIKINRKRPCNVSQRIVIEWSTKGGEDAGQ